MPPEEIEAYCLLAELLTARVRLWEEKEPEIVRRSGGTIPLPPPQFYHYHQSDLEWASELLVKLGILKPISEEPFECTFTFEVAQDHVLQHVRAVSESGPPFEELLGAFVKHASDFGGGFRLYETSSFPVCAEYDPLFQALTKLGYAKRQGMEYLWSPKVRPIMEKANLWPLGDEPSAHGRRTGRK